MKQLNKHYAIAGAAIFTGILIANPLISFLKTSFDDVMEAATMRLVESRMPELTLSFDNKARIAQGNAKNDDLLKALYILHVKNGQLAFRLEQIADTAAEFK